MTNTCDTMCAFHIYDREINPVANAAHGWWFGAMGVVWCCTKPVRGCSLLKPEGETGMLLSKIDTSCQIYEVSSFIKLKDL